MKCRCDRCGHDHERNPFIGYTGRVSFNFFWLMLFVSFLLGAWSYLLVVQGR